ncbi:MAG TPA: AmmeMemoRadiSam system protein B [Usitatibacter sp.]|nr:AmmeMemoRadiSam system protein B [Usitatibacter sp.]
MPAVRPAAVAGMFYPGEPSSLAAEVASYLAAAPAAKRAAAPKAIIAPHAGYMYSGAIAGSVYARIAPLAGRVRRVVLAGPAHRVHVPGVALPAVREFETPLGAVALDEEAIAIARRFPFVEVNDRAHALEHSLEVHLPFLKAALGDFRLMPLVVGDAGPAQMAALLEALWGGEETLVVVSSDLSHYLPYESARQRDGGTARAILGLDAHLTPDDACGAAPINGLLELARSHALEPELVDLRNSGDTAGSRDRVVGYGAFAFYEPRHG